MRFRFGIKKILSALIFNVGRMKYNFVSGVVGVNRPIKKYKQTRVRYRNKHVGGNNTGISEEHLHYINITTEKNFNF